jgi:hypothetical protein
MRNEQFGFPLTNDHIQDMDVRVRSHIRDKDEGDLTYDTWD